MLHLIDRRRVRASWASAVLGLALFATGHAVAADLPAGVKSLIPAAKKESEVKIYGRTLKPDQVKAFSKAISDFYGFPIKLNMAGGLHTAKTAEIALAVKKGAPTGIDVFWSSFNTTVRLEKAGALMDFDWVKELGIDPALRTRPNTVRSHDISLAYVSYNTNLVKAAEAPKSYEDLLNPKWKGRIAIPRSPSPWVFLATAMDEDKVGSLLTALIKDQKAKMLPRFGNVRTRVLSGEFAIGIGIDVFTLERGGAPIAMAPVSPLALTPWSFHLMKDTKSPNLAKLWGYFATTPQGQKALDEIAGISRVSSAGTGLFKLAQGKRVVTQDYEFVQKNLRRLSKKYAKIMKVR